MDGLANPKMNTTDGAHHRSAFADKSSMVLRLATPAPNGPWLIPVDLPQFTAAVADAFLRIRHRGVDRHARLRKRSCLLPLLLFLIFTSNNNFHKKLSNSINNFNSHYISPFIACTYNLTPINSSRAHHRQYVSTHIQQHGRDSPGRQLSHASPYQTRQEPQLRQGRQEILRTRSQKVLVLFHPP